MTDLETIREQFRPHPITTLFVDESAPYGGTFFYNQNSGLFREMRKAFHGHEHFLEDFKRNGFYLDDLVPTPVNQLKHSERIALCRHSISSFVERLKVYQPKTIVILMIAIQPMVVQAMHQAGLSQQPYCTPYPGFGNQPRFHKAMSEIIPNLPVANGSTWKEYK
jgi:hypothetical protein